MKFFHNGQAMLVGVERIDHVPSSVTVIGCNATGTDHLPWDEINRRGIKVFSLKGEREFLDTVTSTAEHTFGLILALVRGYKSALNWPYPPRESSVGHKLAGKVFGIIGGRGRIGTQVAELAKAFRMSVLTADRGNDTYPLLAMSDIVTLHIPLDGNEGYFNADMFNEMKRGAFLVNTSRPGVVDSVALLQALRAGTLAGAAVDFADDQELVNYARERANLVLTNHLGGATVEDMTLTEDFILKKVDDFLCK